MLSVESSAGNWPILRDDVILKPELITKTDENTPPPESIFDLM